MRSPEVRTERLFGLDFVADATISEISDVIVDAAATPVVGWRCVVTPNVDHLVRYRTHDDEARVARSAFLVLPDGMPVVWASKLLGSPLRSRLTGSDLFPELWRTVTSDRVPVVVVSPRQDVSSRLVAEHPGCRCVEPPFFDVDDTQTVDQVVSAIDDAVSANSARLVFVALSVVKTHLIASQLRQRWQHRETPTPIVMLVGASPEFYLGLVPRAPTWMRTSGLEWLHRLAHDPRRLAKRYLVDDVGFIRLIWAEHRSARR